MSKSIKYRYALAGDETLVDVLDLDRNLLLKGTKFYSLDFKQELIPRLGKIKQKHFAHKPNIDAKGSKETYLHALGKKVFYEEYRDCLTNHKPFYLEYFSHKECDRLFATYGFKCQLECEEMKYDLTKYFTQITVEPRDGEFIPDLLLVNPTNNSKIYIEIAVTHLSSERKLNSQNRIIEFSLNGEEDISMIRDARNGIQEAGAAIYNFKEKTEVGNFCKDKCTVQEFHYFLVTKDGRCKLHTVKEKELDLLVKKHAELTGWSIIEPITSIERINFFSGVTQGDIFRYYAAKAWKAETKVRNCFLCRYHGTNQFRGEEFSEGQPIFCKFLKKPFGSNQASGCQYFKAEKKHVDEYIRCCTKRNRFS